MTTLTVSATNNSMHPGTFMLFQIPEDSVSGTIFSVAWKTQFCNPQDKTVFSWVPEYAFSCASTGKLSTGVQYNPNQLVHADPDYMNSIHLDYRGYGFFEDLNPNGTPGMLTVQNNESIPIDQESVGIAIANSTVFATQAQPNIIQVFKPLQKYWIAFGNYREGQVLNFHNIPNSCELHFPAGINEINILMYPDGSYSIR